MVESLLLLLKKLPYLGVNIIFIMFFQSEIINWGLLGFFAESYLENLSQNMLKFPVSHPLYSSGCYISIDHIIYRSILKIPFSQ